MTIPLRIFRSFRSNFYENDILRGPENYSDAYFDELTANGFNAVWLRGLLRNLAYTDVFPNLGEGVAAHQDALNAVVERAARHGVHVLLYLQEPQALPSTHPFWVHHPEARGHTAPFEDYEADPLRTAFCTSESAVRAWLRAAMTGLFRAVPNLGGWFAITTSEYPAHCYSRILGYRQGEQTTCPRCRERHPMAIVRDVLQDLYDGTRAASAEALTIAWNWSWAYYEEDPQPSLLPYLPADMAVMLDWERGGYHALPNGKPYFVDEYSLAYAGPSERFMALYTEARRRNLPVMVKLQIGTTHELATVPNLPVVDTLYRKLVDAERLGAAGMLATWNFGNTFSLNTATIARFVETSDRPAPEAFVKSLAEGCFGLADGSGVGKAVAYFSKALAWLPSDQDLLYFWPGNYAPSYPLTLAPLTGAPMGWSCLLQERGDDLSATETQFTADETVECLRHLLAEWDAGVALLDDALSGSEEKSARLERGVAHAISHIYRSTLHVYQVYLLRRDRPEDMDARYGAILAAETANLTALLPWVEADPRLGFHAECQRYMFTPESIRAKITDLQDQLRASASQK
ncbi:MAG: hypothetical protein BWY76_01773 [bacterium ADurb.Bin429]|nr:MAG: hypothetical protein BWY76_01773 [bacterium ADurb.Bin429]